jgi:hypothetical protein
MTSCETAAQDSGREKAARQGARAVTKQPTTPGKAAAPFASPGLSTTIEDRDGPGEVVSVRHGQVIAEADVESARAGHGAAPVW